MMKADSWAQIEAPMQGGDHLPMMSQIGLNFPIFLIYISEPAENLPGNMHL